MIKLVETNMDNIDLLVIKIIEDQMQHIGNIILHKTRKTFYPTGIILESKDFIQLYEIINSKNIPQKYIS